MPPAVVGGIGNPQRAAAAGQSAAVVGLAVAVTLAVDGTAGGGTITHGSQLTRAMCLPRVGLTNVGGTVNASSLGASISGKHFTGTFVPDINCTLTDCQFDAPVNNQAGVTVQLVNCLVSPTAVGDWCIGPEKVSATRCALEGCSDGIRFDNMDIVECWVRTALQSAIDHNDGIQAFQASAGGSILRNNIDCRPGGDTSNSTTTGAIFLADSSQGETAVRDNYLAGGNGVLRLHESMHYRVTGNRILANSWAAGTGPVSTTNAISGAFLEWSDNQTTDGTVLTP